jgi:hypothetical protein
MIDYLIEAADCLSKAERELRELLGKAAHNGDYSATRELSRVAQEVARLMGSLPGTNGAKKVIRTSAANALSPVYPKFYREKDRLVLVGQQRKSADQEYQHKCPKEVLDKLVAALLRSPNDLHQSPLTDYPAYLPATCLRWFRRLGLVRKHGHRGYQVLDPEHFEAKVEMQWERLPVF